MSIAEVAEFTEVFTATVSQVINGISRVRPKTIKRFKGMTAKIGHVHKTLDCKRGPRLKNLLNNSSKNPAQTGIIALMMCMKLSFIWRIQNPDDPAIIEVKIKPELQM